MVEYYQERKQYSTLTLSLLIHIIFILGLLHITHQQTLFVHKKLLLDDKKKSNQPNVSDPITTINLTKDPDDPLSLPPTVAALKPRASSFGAPLVFQEKAENQPTLFDPHAQDLSSQEVSKSTQEQNNTQTQDPNSSQESLSESQEQESTHVDQEPEEKIEQAPQESSDQKQVETQSQDSPQDTQQESFKEEPLHDSKTVKKEHTAKPKKIVFHDIAVSPPSSAQQASKKMPDRNAVSAGPIERKLTFADLAQGFIQSIKNEGEDWLEREGDPTKRPDMKELKYLGYAQKLVWYMQNEWRANQSKLSNLIFSKDLILTLIVTILKNGEVAGIQIVQSSESPELDSFLIKGIHNASPYPPIPQHFNTDTFDFPLAIHNYPNQDSSWNMKLAQRPTHMQ